MDTKGLSDLLVKRGAMQPCARCGGKAFNIVDNYGKLIIGEKPDANILGQVVPVALVICANCGAVSLHALGALGLLNKDSGETTNGE